MAFRSFGLVLGASVFLLPTMAAAFCRTTTSSVPADFDPQQGGCYTVGKPLFWRSLCLDFSMQKDGTRQMPFATAESLTRQGFEAWTKISCSDGKAPSVLLSEIGTAECSKVQYNKNGWPNANIVVFRDDEWPHNDSFNTVALTTVTYNSDTGEIYDADIEINTATRTFQTEPPFGSDSYDYLSAITHEAGHFLGLAHSQESTATMYALYRPGSTNIRTPSADDVSGLCSIYPSGGVRETAVEGPIVASCNPTPRGGFTSACVADGVDGEPPPGTKTNSKGCSTTPGGFPGGAGFGVAFGLSALAFARARRRR